MDAPGEPLWWSLVEGALEGLWGLVWHVLPAVAGVLLGGLVINRFFVRKANVAGLVERACNLLDDLKDLCASYWTRDAAGIEAKEDAISEAKIKASLLQINALVTLLTQKYGPIPESVKPAVLHLVSICTGGDFESRARKADRQNFMRVARAIDALAVELQKLKL